MQIYIWKQKKSAHDHDRRKSAKKTYVIFDFFWNFAILCTLNLKPDSQHSTPKWSASWKSTVSYIYMKIEHSKVTVHHSQCQNVPRKTQIAIWTPFETQRMRRWSEKRPNLKCRQQMFTIVL